MNRQNMPEIFSDAEINSIANRVLDVPSILGIAILLTLNSGLRLGELCALRWSDIDFSSGVISVQRTVQRLTVDGVGKLVIQPPKSLSSLRRIPIPADMLALLKQVRLSNSIDSFLMTGTDAPNAQCAVQAAGEVRGGTGAERYPRGQRTHTDNADAEYPLPSV